MFKNQVVLDSIKGTLTKKQLDIVNLLEVEVKPYLYIAKNVTNNSLMIKDINVADFFLIPEN